MTSRKTGWLFGLEGTAAEVVTSALTIRRMTALERDWICRCANDFFARDERIWMNTTERFPYVAVADGLPNQTPIGGEQAAGVLLSILSRGEVRTPVQWIEQENGSRGSSSSSDIAALFYRLINDQFAPVQLEAVQRAFATAVDELKNRIHSPATQLVEPVLLERFLGSKSHPIFPAHKHQADTILVSRAADTVMMLEYMFYEGSTSEISFRLGMSIAWLLGETHDTRKMIVDTLKPVYDLRSKRVHGAPSTRPLKADVRASLTVVDHLLRRALMTKVLAGLTDDEWVALFTSARLGRSSAKLDLCHWMPSDA